MLRTGVKKRNIPTKENLRHNHFKYSWAFSKRYRDAVQAAFESGQAFSDAQMYAIDLCAEHLRLPISQMLEVVTDYLDQFQHFLGNGNCSWAESALMNAENYFIEQFLAIPDRDQEKGRFLLNWCRRRMISRIKEKIGKPETEKLGLVDIAIYLFELELGPWWESSEATDEFGCPAHVPGRKERREEMEEAKVSAIQL